LRTEDTTDARQNDEMTLILAMGTSKELGHAIAQVVSCWLPTAVNRVHIWAGMWGLWWTKWHWGRFFPSTLVSPANHHSTNFSIIIITRGSHNRPIDGRSAKWTQLNSTSHYTNFKSKELNRP
jgi:hypothetical protein